MKKLILLFLIFINLFLFINITNASINLTVSPVRYEFTGDRGKTLTGTIKLFNNSTVDQEVILTTKNAVGMDNSGKPEIIEEVSTPELYLSDWVKFEKEKYKVIGNSVIDIPFSITIPELANPGGHYGAVFFNVSENKTKDGEVGVKKRIGVLILLKVNGEVNSLGELNGITISGEKKEIVIDKGTGFPIIDKIKNKIVSFLDLFNNTDLNSADENIVYDIVGKDFSVLFDINFSNKGNIHIKPKGKIEISDIANKETYKKIGKESIKDKGGVTLGERIVDFVPINDDGGNILPNTTRKFSPEWKGFAYETLNEKGEKVIEFKSPRVYFTENSKKDYGYLMPWEKISTKSLKKDLEAKINIVYNDPLGKEVNFDSSKKFFVIYDEEYIGLNWIVIIIGGIILLMLAYYFFIILPKKRKKKEKDFEEKIKKKLEKEKK